MSEGFGTLTVEMASRGPMPYTARLLNFMPVHNVLQWTLVSVAQEQSKPINRQYADLLSAAADAYKFVSEAGREPSVQRIEREQWLQSNDLKQITHQMSPH